MALAINNFISSMSKAKGFARPSQYAVQLNLPPALTNIQRSFGPQLTLHCDSVSMPGHDLQTQSIQYGSEPAVDMVTGHGYEGLIQASFYLDTRLNEKRIFEIWQEQACSTSTHKANYYDDYIGSMEIHQLSSTGALTTKFAGLNLEIAAEGLDRLTGDSTEMITYAIQALEVYPATVGDIEYSYASANEISKISVGFAFKQWVRIK
tara:strand:- start:415 stop:1035 length:621 start_codon:yes stop_codon:yes gene_type:complete